MAKGHRSKIKRERNAQKDNRPSAKLSYARISAQKACFVLDAIRGKDVKSAIGILTYNPRYASSVILKLLNSAMRLCAGAPGSAGHLEYEENERGVEEAERALPPERPGRRRVGVFRSAAAVEHPI